MSTQKNRTQVLFLNNRILLSIFILVLSAKFTYAQSKITGIVKDSNGEALPGAAVLEKGTKNGTVTDFDGNFTLNAAKGITLIISFAGFETQEVLVDKLPISIVLKEGLQLEEVVVVGSRSSKRTKLNTAVPIDVIEVNKIATQNGKIQLNEILQYVAPSFNATTQSGSDGSEHIVPASLRGLGPDQTLVLINGKRRHQSSLVNIFGSRGRGNTGTDLNTIPASAIKRVEILRDGAAAQYGSDAIAGVINIVLKDGTGSLDGFVSYGAYDTSASGDFKEGTPNTKGYRLDEDGAGNTKGKDVKYDGGSLKVGLNYGVKVGNKGGFVNFTTEFLNKEKTLRPGYARRKGYGEASIQAFNAIVNASLPIDDKSSIYAFGGRSYRDTDAYASVRSNPTARNVVSIYPKGFTPRITSIITDNSIVAGFKTKLKNDWNLDISNTYGKNNFHYFIKGTLNASLGESSPTDFDAGGHSLAQNTINLDASKYFESVLKGLNVSFGAEYRTENFIIFSGEEASWATYDKEGNVATDFSPKVLPIDPITKKIRPGGSQGFPGYSPENEVNRSRTNISLFADTELDITDSFLVGLAGRFEKYSDFGSTINGKFSTRLKASKNINFRGSVSTGFRAPSLAQVYYNLKFILFKEKAVEDGILASNTSPVTAAFGINKLKEEKALNGSLGFTASFGKFTATVDGYYIGIKDRIVLTDYFSADNIQGVDIAQFFANGVDTQTKGLDVVLSWKKNFDKSSLSTVFSGNFNDMRITNIKNGKLDEDKFFGARNQAYLLASSPKNKLALSLTYSRKRFDVSTAITRFSKIVLKDHKLGDDVYGAKTTVDLNTSFAITKGLKLHIGSNNLFNVYPDQQNDGRTESGGYWDAVQMGTNGAYYYAKLDFAF